MDNNAGNRPYDINDKYFIPGNGEYLADNGNGDNSDCGNECFTTNGDKNFYDNGVNAKYCSDRNNNSHHNDNNYLSYNSSIFYSKDYRLFNNDEYFHDSADGKHIDRGGTYLEAPDQNTNNDFFRPRKEYQNNDGGKCFNVDTGNNYFSGGNKYLPDDNGNNYRNGD